jgi:hypothetical protein
VAFQIVRVTDTEIVVWNTEHGHIYGYYISPETHALEPLFCRNIDEATQTAESLKDEARRFAVQEARDRKLLA